MSNSVYDPRQIVPTRGNSERIRNNLMFKLGVEPDRAHAAPQQPREVSILGHVKVTTEPLKYEDEEDEDAANTQPSEPWTFSSLFGGNTQQRSPAESDDENVKNEVPQSPPLSSTPPSDDAESTTDSSKGSASPERKLHFNEEVQVCLIPKKEEYSSRIRSHLWTNAEELAINAHRNSVEFASEGWDWRNVMEDENMYRCLSTNELIHPVHIEQ